MLFSPDSFRDRGGYDFIQIELFSLNRRNDKEG